MSQLTDKDFWDIKYVVEKGRLTISGMRLYLLGVFLYSTIILGVSIYAATANTVGWSNLHEGWHIVFYMEAVMFAVNMILLLLCWGKNAFTQKLLTIAVVIYTYKIALDPFLVILLASKDRGTYHLYAPIVLIVVIMSFVIHFGWLIIKIYNIKKEKIKSKGNTYQKSKLRFLISMIFFLVVLTGAIIKNGVLNDMELTFILATATIVCIAMLLGAVEYLIALYCIFHFPSFSVNPPPVQNYTNKKRRKKKKR